MTNKVLKAFFSMPAMRLYVALLALAMAIATFVENGYGTVAAKALIYNAKWFEFVILLTTINAGYNIYRFKLYRWSKLPIFLFHLSFLIIILGASITRFTSQEGVMKIREGASSNVMSSYTTYFYAQMGEGEDMVTVRQPVFLSTISKRQVNAKLKDGGNTVKFRSFDYTSGRLMMRQMGSSAAGLPPDVTSLRVKVNGVETEIGLQGYLNRDMQLYDYEVNGVKFSAGIGSMHSELPFSIQLVDFQLDRYPGSNSPSSYASEVVLIDEAAGVNRPFRIFMNNILKYQGYRFYQSSYDQDEKGTVLSVNDDAWGTTVTYIGYGLMIITLLLALVAPGSRFVEFIKSSKKPILTVLILVVIGIGQQVQAQRPHLTALQKTEAKEFGKLWVQGENGRFKPINTLSNEIVRKVTKENRYSNMSPDEFLLSLLLNRQQWEQEPLFEIPNAEIRRLLGVSQTRVAFSQFFKGNQYLLGDLANQALNTNANQRSAIEKDMLKLDEQLNVFYMAATGMMLRVFPDQRDVGAKWFDLTTPVTGLPEVDSLFITNAFNQYLLAIFNNQPQEAEQFRTGILNYQTTYGAAILPSERKASFEVLYNRILIFERLAPFYATLGLILLIVQFIALFRPRKWQKGVSSFFAVLLSIAFVLHTAGLALRWYVSGHAPMSNGYESMIFVAWGTILAGVILQKRSKMAVALTSILAAMALLVAHLSWMTPEITNLMPVLKSPWLTIHVAVIMTSYSFLGLGALIGAVIMILYIGKTKRTQQIVDAHVDQLTRINQIVTTVGLYLITIGCFLGAIWANVSWGRYWGWDPKETWCLITILVYTFVTHMHHIKGLNSKFNFNLASLLAFSSVLMTYFGVNYFLGGNHSYAGGTSLSVPIGAYVAVVVIVVLAYWAYFNQQRFERKDKK